MRRTVISLVLAFLLVGSGTVLSGCYSTRVTTDAEPSAKKIEKAWATGFLFGLATPGATVDAADRCQNGVAVVESQLSFLNMLAAGITFSLYTPMSVTVTCAEGGNMSGLMDSPKLDMANHKLDEIEPAETVPAAVEKSAISNKPVKVQLSGD